MKVTILTVCYNNEETILNTLNSVLNQSYKNIEHIIVDGKSKDKTKIYLKKYPLKNKKIFHIKKRGVYNALNYGIRKASGDILHILHADDIYNHPDIISNVVKIAKKRKEQIFTSDVTFFNGTRFYSITRFFSAKYFTKNKIFSGIMPPHTGLFFKKKVYKNFLYEEKYKIAGDFALLLDVIVKSKIDFFYTGLLSVRMRSGGISNKNIHSYLITTLEIINAFKNIKFKNNLIRSLLRIPEKISQFVFLRKKIINKDFKLKYSAFFLNNFKYDFLIKNNLTYLDYDRNFIYSAMNLAFLGSYANNEIKKNKYLIHWSDGIFSRNICDLDEKIPGRAILKNLKIPKKIKKITVVGNLSKNAKSYLENLHKRNVKNIPLPYGSIDVILKKFKYKTSKNELILTTLPTPKQEILANHISEKNKYFKIICIGGSIRIASGEEKEVPNIFYNFEYLWRLRYDTKRRAERLFASFINYLIGRYVNKAFKNLKIIYEL